MASIVFVLGSPTPAFVLPLPPPFAFPFQPEF